MAGYTDLGGVTAKVSVGVGFDAQSAQQAKSATKDVSDTIKQVLKELEQITGAALNKPWREQLNLYSLGRTGAKFGGALGISNEQLVKEFLKYSKVQGFTESLESFSKLSPDLADKFLAGLKIPRQKGPNFFDTVTQSFYKLDAVVRNTTKPLDGLTGGLKGLFKGTTGAILGITGLSFSVYGLVRGFLDATSAGQGFIIELRRISLMVSNTTANAEQYGATIQYMSDTYVYSVTDMAKAYKELARVQGDLSIDVTTIAEKFVMLSRIMGKDLNDTIADAVRTVGMLGTGSGSTRSLVTLGITGKDAREILELARRRGDSDAALLKLANVVDRRFGSEDPQEYVTLWEQIHKVLSDIYVEVGVLSGKAVKQVQKYTDTGFLGMRGVQNWITSFFIEYFSPGSLERISKSQVNEGWIAKVFRSIFGGIKPISEVERAQQQRPTKPIITASAKDNEFLQQFFSLFAFRAPFNFLPVQKGTFAGGLGQEFQRRTRFGLTYDVEEYNKFIISLNKSVILLEDQYKALYVARNPMSVLVQLQELELKYAADAALYYQKHGELITQKINRQSVYLDLEKESLSAYRDATSEILKEGLFGGHVSHIENLRKAVLETGDLQALRQLINEAEIYTRHMYAAGQIGIEEYQTRMAELEILSRQSQEIARQIGLRKQQEEKEKQALERRKQDQQQEEERIRELEQFIDKNKTPQDVIAEIERINGMAQEAVRRGMIGAAEAEQKRRMAIGELLIPLLQGKMEQPTIQLPQTLVQGQRGTWSEIQKIRAEQRKTDPTKKALDIIIRQLGVQQNQARLLEDIRRGIDAMKDKLPGAGR